MFGCRASAQTAGSSSKTLGALAAHADPDVVDHQLEARVLARDAVEMVERARHQHHQRDAGLLGGRPEPVGGAVGEEVAVVLVVEGEAHAEHARLLAPVGHQRPARGIAEREAPHHREAVRIGARGFERHVVAVALPRGRHQDHAAHLGQVHLEEQRLLQDLVGLLCFRRAARRPRAARALRGPEVHLRVDDVHGRSASYRGALSRRSSYGAEYEKPLM